MCPGSFRRPSIAYGLGDERDVSDVTGAARGVLSTL
jgi:hypothetical protein